MAGAEEVEEEVEVVEVGEGGDPFDRLLVKSGVPESH